MPEAKRCHVRCSSARRKQSDAGSLGPAPSHPKLKEMNALAEQVHRESIRQAVEIRCLDARLAFDFADHEHLSPIVKLAHRLNHSTVTLLARFLGLSTSVPRAQAVW